MFAMKNEQDTRKKFGAVMPSSAPSLEELAGDPSLNGRARVLVVDDEEAVRNVVAGALNEAHDVRTTGSPREALEEIKKGGYDIVILDIRLPEMNGLDVLRNIREISPETDVIVLTGLTDIETCVACMKAGAAEYITKPIVPDLVRVVVDRAMERRELVRKAARSDRLERLAHVDDLTGLHNHRAFVSAMNRAVNHARRYGRPLALLIVDMDNLKKINDHLGHSAGNAALIAVAGCLVEGMRSTDFVSRLHGDEFGVIMPETNKSGCLAAGRRVIDLLSKRHPVVRSESQEAPVTVSCGGACFPDHAQTSEELFKRADEALYVAKSSDKSQVVVWERSLAKKEGKQN